MSRFGWMYANSALTGTVANGPTNSIQINSGSQVLTGTSNFTYNPVTNTVTLAGVMTGSSLVISASVISASTYLGIVGGGSSTPGGTNTTIQFNSGSTFSGSTNLIYNNTTNVLSGTTAQFTVVTASAYSGGSFIGSTVSGTTAQFTTITGSTALLTTITASVISSSGDIQAGGGLSVFGIMTTQGNIQVGGAIAGRYRTFAGNFSVATNSWFCAINSSGAAVTASLGSAATYYPGQQITFKDVGGFAGTNNILIKASGSQTIDGASGVSLTANSSSVTILADGSSAFYIIGIV